MSLERDELVQLACALEKLAEDGEEPFERLLAEFNARVNGECTRSTFLVLYQAEEPSRLVDRLLEIRNASSLSRVFPHSRADLLALRAQAHSYSDRDHAGQALAANSRLPHHIAHQLGSGFGPLPCWPSDDELVDFALGYEPPKTQEDVFAFVRRWLDDTDEGRCTVFFALGEVLLEEYHKVFAIDGLAPIMRLLGSGIDAQYASALRRLRKLVGPSASA
jgi:hypothetical protein